MLCRGAARPWDTIAVLLFAALLLPAAATVAQADTTVIVIRHAEKNNDALNNDGKARADNLFEVLKHADISAIYTSEANRTRQTATPLARKIGVSLVQVSRKGKSEEDYAKELAKKVRDKKHREQSVLIVSHSDIVHHLVNELSDATIHQINYDDEYDNLFVIIIPKNANKGKLIKATYGAPRRCGDNCKN